MFLAWHSQPQGNFSLFADRESMWGLIAWFTRPIPPMLTGRLRSSLSRQSWSQELLLGVISHGLKCKFIGKNLFCWFVMLLHGFWNHWGGIRIWSKTWRIPALGASSANHKLTSEDIAFSCWWRVGLFCQDLHGRWQRIALHVWCNVPLPPVTILMGVHMCWSAISLIAMNGSLWYWVKHDCEQIRSKIHSN